MAKLPKLFSKDDAPMWESIAAAAMCLQRCTACGDIRYPPGPACPRCLGMDSEWQPISGRGTVLSWTVFHRRYLEAYPPPYLVVAALLDEGPIVIAGMLMQDAPNLRIDAPVELFYDEHPDGYSIPRFRVIDKVARLGP